MIGAGIFTTSGLLMAELTIHFHGDTMGCGGIIALAGIVVR